MRAKTYHLTPVSRVPGVAQTALELKLSSILLYYGAALDIFNNLLVYSGGFAVNTVNSLTTSLPYKNATGGSSQDGGDTGGDGGTGGDDGGGIL
jgi:hypothetical protein